MALLQLENIGKIYASEGAIAVGIRGVNLSFDKGEFVCITGKSGSGKSTLLNVISGMDSYEAGELYIEGETTSHYLEAEREEYRQKYISFIFQDYNIIESFTVLENVELALMHIDDKSERRKAALELIERVGLTSHIKHRGSKLLGGQKQRTVIARALAKDSPIILADEPTGNLDSETSKEIIKLLGEVAKDKLLIVVTHNYDDFEDYATRHVRIFDGEVEADEVIAQRSVTSENETESGDFHDTGTDSSNNGESDGNPDFRDTDKGISEKTAKKKLITKADITKGCELGAAIFKAKPKLSVFLAVLLIIGTMALFLLTSLCSGAVGLFEGKYMFTHIDGRVVITKRTGEVITDAELEALKNELGAKSTLHYDLLLDQSHYYSTVFEDAVTGEQEYETVNCTFGKDYGNDIIGRYPEKAGEALLRLPISYRNLFGKDELRDVDVYFGRVLINVTGVSYYLDNNITPEILMTEEGFNEATAIYYLLGSASTTIQATLTTPDGDVGELQFYGFYPSYEAEYGKLHLADQSYKKAIGQYPDTRTTVHFAASYYNYRYDYFDGATSSKTFTKELGDEYISRADAPTNSFIFYDDYSSVVVLHPALLAEIAKETLSLAYKQASLFFEDDKAAHEVIETLEEKGYVAIASDTPYTPTGEDVLLETILAVGLGAVWLFGIAFLWLFISLCSKKSLEAFASDISIMRSMGIPLKVIKIGMYVRMLLSVIPAYITVIVISVLVYTTPTFNKIFAYLYFKDYVLIFLGVLLLTVNVTRSQVKNLFGESVSRALKGGTRNA